MGSINPVFLLAEAVKQKPEELAAGLHASVTLGVGQFCTNPGLVFIESGAANQAFLTKLATLIDNTAAGTMLTADLCSAYKKGVQRFSQFPGVRQVAGKSTSSDSNPGRAGAALFVTDGENFLRNHALMDEVFGPSTLVVECKSRDEMLTAARQLEGQLTATIHGTESDLTANQELIEIAATKAGRLVCNGFPTGVEVCHAMTHGGPYPATSDGRSTSVGTRAIERFARPVCFQGFPESALPDELKESNPLGIWRLVDGKPLR
jgi:NADP-dependent aldehyde dehydrogenase